MWLTFGAQARELRDGELVVGSGADADWRVSTADLMPRHFALTIHGLNASLRAASRDTVIVVNGRQLAGTTHLLNDGDVIEAGSGKFVFGEAEAKVASTEAQPTAPGYLIDEAAQRAQPLVNRSTTLGRDGSNTIVVRDPAASRFHAEVRREAGGFALHSMGSAGTRVNARPVDGPVLLEDGDVIELAYAKFRFVRSVPSGVAWAGGHDARTDTSQRNPTLTTGRISVVPKRAAGGAGVFIMVAVLVAIAVAAYLTLR